MYVQEYSIWIVRQEKRFWYYPPDNFSRAVAFVGDNHVLVTGMDTRDIWQVTLDEYAQYKDVFKLREVTVPLWLVIVFFLLSLPLLLDEIMKKEITIKNVWEKPSMV